MRHISTSVAVAVLAAALLLAKHRARRRRRVVGIIPARYQSVRFPGKPLVDILGKPMVVRTYEQARRSVTLDALFVATDDERIADACRKAGAHVLMTSSTCPNGTERCNEAVGKLEKEFDIVVNIQGDEPLMEPEVIDDIVRALQDSPDAVYSTACTPLAREEVAMRNRVKCIVDACGYAIYFSRGLLPANKQGVAKPFPEPFAEKPYLLHLGIQCYDRRFLAKYCKMPATPLMLMEDLEQLKVIENGYKIKVIMVDHCAHGVDEPEDVASIESKMHALGCT
ncbi:hypothetical protein WJX72_011452 [[Myrmecia] bisecta]|uniref:3-deoxy-manno-octulosonate cytidylyltransferase n=1 Tax=[Myrmecia] bisecta TaxID=41462 RepID=A0AAW1QGF7_9CHLO